MLEAKAFLLSPANLEVRISLKHTMQAGRPFGGSACKVKRRMGADSGKRKGKPGQSGSSTTNMKEKGIETLQHTIWRCQYHVAFASKYHRMVIYSQIKKDIGQILRKPCEQKGVEIIEVQACPDHISMLLSIPPRYSVAPIMGYLKRKTACGFSTDTGKSAGRKYPGAFAVFHTSKAKNSFALL